VATLGIPKTARKPLVALAQLDDVIADALIDALISGPALQPVRDLERRAEDVLPEAERDDFRPLVDALLSLRGGLRDIPLEQIVAGVASSADLDLEADARQLLQLRLHTLLSSEALSSTANAIELLTQNERNYRTARVLTDVRHVFAEDAVEKPAGAVIIEVLALQTWNRDGHAETLHVAMDETDLRELRDAMQRALDKTSNLRGLLREQGMTYFELDKRGV